MLNLASKKNKKLQQNQKVDCSCKCGPTRSNAELRNLVPNLDTDPRNVGLKLLIWPFEGNHYADVALGENEFDTPGVEN